MASRLTRALVMAASLFNGIMAGGNFIRLFVEMPAWRQVGPVAWASFSRHADLGAGLLIYPMLAIGGAVLMLAAAIVFHFDRGAPHSAALPIYLSLALVVGGLATTRFAAPYMLSLRTIGDDPAALRAAFEGFDRWGTIRGVMQMLAFPMNLWALVAVHRSS
jgi:hypothetical protein